MKTALDPYLFNLWQLMWRLGEWWGEWLTSFVDAKNLYNSNGMYLQTMKTCTSNKNISINLLHNCQTMQSNHKKIQLLNNGLPSTSKTFSFKITKKAMATNIKLLFVFQQRISCFLLFYKKQNSYRGIDIGIYN